MNPNIVILAAGVSSRMKRLTPVPSGLDPASVHDAQRKPKAMIGVGENSRPFLDFLLFNIESSGYGNVVIVLSDRDDSIREYYEKEGRSQEFKGLNITYTVQPIPAGRQKPLGTADALLRALEATPSWKGQHVTVCNADNIYSTTALRLLLEDAHDNAMIDYDRSALRFDVDRIAQFSVIQKDGEGFLQNIVEKPSPDEIKNAADMHGRVGVSMNIFRFSYHQILPFLESVPLHPVRHEKELPAAVTMMVQAHPRSLFTIPLSEHVIDLTSQADIPLVKEYLQRHFRQWYTA